MIYSPLVKKASLIAFAAHKEDFDKGGYPYVMHLFYLAFQMRDEASVCAALLHDVIEDHADEYSFEFLAAEGFPESVLAPLRLLTHDPSVPYIDYVKAIGENPTARAVKIADLAHNLDATRVGGKPFYKTDLYREALSYLKSL